MALIDVFIAFLGRIFKWDTEVPPVPVQEPQEAVLPIQQPLQPNPILMPETDSIDTLLPWNTSASFSHENFHNVRVLCDLEGLSFDMKNRLTATVWGESEFNVHAKCLNYARTPDGTKYVSSVDNGIAQWNTHYHGTEITPDQAVNNPEFAIRLMCKYFKNGLENQWVARSSGRYLQFMGKTL